MSKYVNPFEEYDALVILTRQGLVMTSNDVQLTIEEDRELQRLNKVIVDRTERMKMDKDRMDSKNNVAPIYGAGYSVIKKQQAKTKAKMFQYIKIKKGGKRK